MLRKISLALFVAEKITTFGPAKSASIWVRSFLSMTLIRPSWTSKMAPRLCFLPVQSILSGGQVYEQVPCDTNYVCVHKYVTPESLLPATGTVDYEKRKEQKTPHYVTI